MRLTAALVLGSMMAGLAAVLQLGPTYAGGLGFLLAMAASLPMLVQAYVSPRTCLWSYVTATLLLSLFALQEAMVFAFTTAPLGLAVGYGLHRRLPWWQVAGGAAGVLLLGLVGLAYVVGLPPLGAELKALGAGVELLLYAGFALVYSGIWTGVGKVFVARLPLVMDGRSVSGRQ